MKREKHNLDNSLKIDALKLRDAVKIYANGKGKTASGMLVEIGLPTSCIANSTRSYWIHFGKENVRNGGLWGPSYGRKAYEDGYTFGFILKDVYKKIIDNFKLSYDDYLLDKPKPIAKEPAENTEKVIYTHKYDEDLKDIKELLRVQNILLKKLVDELK